MASSPVARWLQCLWPYSSTASSRNLTGGTATDHAAVRAALDSVAGTFPFDPRALTVQAPAPTITLRVTPPKDCTPQPIRGETK